VTLVGVRPVPDALAASASDAVAARFPGAASAAGRLGDLHTLGFAVRVPDDVAPTADDVARAARDLRDEIRPPGLALGVDVAVTTGDMAELGPGLILTDVDSTLLQDEVIEVVAAHAGVEAEVAAITARAMDGELDFHASLRERVALLAGLDAEAVLADATAAVRLSPGAREMFLTARDRGVPTGVVSGGFIEIVGPITEPLGVRFAAANRLEVGEDGRLTGRTVGEVIGRDQKADRTRAWSAEVGIGVDRVLAAGDGANDLAMLDLVGLGVGYEAKQIVREQADAIVSTGRLDVALALTGVTDL
jgi:phosphoserine phosphatase